MSALPPSLTPLTLQILFLGLLWGFVAILALRFILVAIFRRPDLPPELGALQPALAPIRELLLEAPAAGDVGPRVERILIESIEISIGRSRSSRLKLDDEFASSNHAVLRREDGKVTLEDLGSTNGTFLNETPVTSRVALKHGDTIRIGKTTIKIR